jgi:hypothetical protein
MHELVDGVLAVGVLSSESQHSVLGQRGMNGILLHNAWHTALLPPTHDAHCRLLPWTRRVVLQLKTMLCCMPACCAALTAP